MVEIRDFDDADLLTFEPAMAELAGVEDWRAMIRGAARSGPAWTATCGASPLGCGGFVELWRGRAHAWCVLAPAIPRQLWPAITHAVRARIDASGFRRIEADVLADFVPGLRWMRVLRFKSEGLAPSFGPNGEDFYRYGWIAAEAAPR